MANDILSLFESLKKQCQNFNASDLHIEPAGMQTSIRMRVDGILTHFMDLPFKTSEQLINHIKLLGNCHVAENRKPQDGRIDRSIRFSTMPTVKGEKCVLRFLTPQNTIIPLSAIGLLDAQLKQLTQAIAKPQGLILITGPTGSGKTTTLYSMLSEINSGERCICTIEDPVEMLVEHVNQTQVNMDINLGFSDILRSLLRQDPDVIMVGEIRDTDTANLALKAAQTGHLVLATLHTNSAIESIQRLSHLGCDRLNIASSLSMIIGQRLVRKCSPTGQLKGRRGIYEVVTIDDAIRCDILNQRTPKLSEYVSLRDHGQILINQGITTPEELNRVCL